MVIAIISILAAILFPVFARARENARRSSCLSNLKQIGIGTMMYVQDYDERYPHYYNSVTKKFWRDIVQPYVKSTQVFICPSSNSTSTLHSNYGANANLIRIIDEQPRSLAEIQSASTGYMLMDYGNYYASSNNVKGDSSTSYGYLPGMGNDGANTHCKMSATTYEAQLADCQGGRHFLGVNIAFADGHAKWLKSNVVVNDARNVTFGVVSPWNVAP